MVAYVSIEFGKKYIGNHGYKSVLMNYIIAST